MTHPVYVQAIYPEGELFHIATDQQTGDLTYYTYCGYPQMPDFPMHSGHFQPGCIYVGLTAPEGVCMACSFRFVKKVVFRHEYLRSLLRGSAADACGGLDEDQQPLESKVNYDPKRNTATIRSLTLTETRLRAMLRRAVRIMKSWVN